MGRGVAWTGSVTTLCDGGVGRGVARGRYVTVGWPCACGAGITNEFCATTGGAQYPKMAATNQSGRQPNVDTILFIREN